MTYHNILVSICALSHLLWNVLKASGAMNESVMEDTLPLTTECSHWIVTMSIMSMPTCIAQADGCAKFSYIYQRPNVGLLMVYIFCIVMLCSGLDA